MSLYALLVEIYNTNKHDPQLVNKISDFFVCTLGLEPTHMFTTKISLPLTIQELEEPAKDLWRWKYIQNIPKTQMYRNDNVKTSTIFDDQKISVQTFSPASTCSFKNALVLASSFLAFSEIGKRSVIGPDEFLTTA